MTTRDYLRKASLVWLLTHAPAAPYAWAQDTERIDPERTRTATRWFDQIGQDVRKLGDWSEQADLFDTMLDRLWADNAWKSEPDQFARELASKVTRIPPWEFEQRMRTMTGMIADRYRLDAGQRTRFKARMLREIFGFAINNAEVITSQAREFIDARLHRRPLTPGDIARWTRDSDPLLADAMMRADRITDATKRDLNAEQLKILEKDYRAFDRRMVGFLKQRDAWARGKWQPRDWGLDKDPIQNPAASPLNRPVARGDTGGSSVAPPGDTPDALVFPMDISPRRPPHRPPDALPHNESTWARYVRKFIKRHRLDAGQRDTALSILGELESRAADYRRRHTEAIRSVPPNQRRTAPALKPIRQMFDELKARTNALLTRTQQRPKDE